MKKLKFITRLISTTSAVAICVAFFYNADNIANARTLLVVNSYTAKYMTEGKLAGRWLGRYALDRVNNVGATELINAVKMNCRSDVIYYLIKHGVDVNKRDNENKSAIYYAIENSRVTLAKHLIETYYVPRHDEDDYLMFVSILRNNKIARYQRYSLMQAMLNKGLFLSQQLFDMILTNKNFDSLTLTYGLQLLYDYGAPINRNMINQVIDTNLLYSKDKTYALKLLIGTYIKRNKSKYSNQVTKDIRLFLTNVIKKVNIETFDKMDLIMSIIESGVDLKGELYLDILAITEFDIQQKMELFHHLQQDLGVVLDKETMYKIHLNYQNQPKVVEQIKALYQQQQANKT